ncbi:MAG TPA: aminoglycoside phosphotransferase family protein [Verrucomicrobiae bacterium]|nr:aminoglycoside phosphotransferase family protein [Verrucomicrobiae bacterium]
MKQPDIKSISHQFQIPGDFSSAAPYGNGHIHDTYCVSYNQNGRLTRYIHQRINHHVFKNPAALMENIRRVTQHLQHKFVGQPDAARRTLTLVPARSGESFHRDAEGNYWRAYLFIEKACSHEAVTTPRQAFEAARAFGRYQQLLTDLPAPRLHETIPHFHDTPKRFAALEEAIELDTNNRAQEAKPEIEFALHHKAMISALSEARLPERITHNDTKFNNVMLDDVSGEGICVIDLDTTMPGLALCDFGDQIRTTTSPVREDDRDLSKVVMQFPMFEALTHGYLSAAGEFLSPEERRYMAVSGKLMTFEVGIRFLTDYLSGDTYFKVHREGHNLDRCRTQFKLVESIEQQEEQMQNLIESLK